MEQSTSTSANKVRESVNAYSVQCSSCWKWRLLPSKETYEEIRARIKENPFTCDIARQWKPEISCETEFDVKPEDQNLLWAKDKPNIPRTPRGWQRIVRVRSAGGTKFADVYVSHYVSCLDKKNLAIYKCDVLYLNWFYVSPSKKRLRSTVEVKWYLGECPQFAQEAITVSQFSFKCPGPFEDERVAKRRPRASSRDSSGAESAGNQAIVPYEYPFPLSMVPNEDPVL